VGGFFAVLVVLAIIGWLAWKVIETRRALETTSVLTHYAPEQAIQIISGGFSGARPPAWTNASGAGHINKRRRGPHGGITMSIDIEPLWDDGCRITMWTSDSRRCAWLPIVICQAGVVSERKKAIARLLAEPDPRQLAADGDGTSMQFADRANSQYW
jgi:hypothetical protein